MVKEIPIAGTIVLKIPAKMVFISGKTDKVSTRKTLSTKGVLAKNAIKFEVDKDITEVQIVKKGSKITNNAKAKKELGKRLQSQVTSYEALGSLRAV